MTAAAGGADRERGVPPRQRGRPLQTAPPPGPGRYGGRVKTRRHSAGGVGVAVILLVQICVVIAHFLPARRTFPPLARSTTDDVWNIGRLLFDNYNLPFQIIGVLVLVATIGVVLLSRREPR